MKKSVEKKKILNKIEELENFGRNKDGKRLKRFTFLILII